MSEECNLISLIMVNNSIPNDIYKNPPLKSIDGIPVFCEVSDYIKNYEEIAVDHLAELGKTGANPFIPEDLWIELENSTKELILKYSKDIGSCRILDVGVGLARLLSLLPPNFQKYGMDISVDYLKIARSKGVNVCCSLVEDMPYKENMFDMVVCTDVLEHVLDLNLACTRILSVLKPNGFLIARVPYRENLSSYLSKDFPYHFAHLRSFDEYSLRLLFERVFRCKVLEHRTVGTIPAPNLFKFGLSSGLKNLSGTIIYHIRRINMGLYRFITKILYHPCDINIVIQKSPSTSGKSDCLKSYDPE